MDIIESRISRKYLVVEEFAENMRQAKFPCAFLAFGSVGRGFPLELSDIDLMTVFDDDFIDVVLDNSFLRELPFDHNGMETTLVVDHFDVNDLKEKKIDFLRFKGVRGGEKVELQFFPLSSIKKAVNFLGGDLVGGTKELGPQNKMKTDNKERPTLTFDGGIAFFRKNQRRIEGRKRIDFDEVGNKKSNGKWIRGLTLGKLISPKILVDSINFAAFLDEVVLRSLIDLLFQIFGLYDIEQGQIVGVKEAGLDHNILYKILRSHKDKRFVYDFGIVEEENLEKRFREQSRIILSQIETNKRG